MRLIDSRRLTGPSLLLDRPGAILDVALEGADTEEVIGRWRAALRPLLERLGWGREQDATRQAADHVSLAFTAPIDALYAATEVNEAAFAAASGEGGDLEAAAERLRAMIATESNPSLVALARAADVHDVTFLADDKRASVGLGAGSRTWPLRRIPASPERIHWRGLADIPVALVTGTNGKTTTVRLIAAMLRAAGRVAGSTSTDRVEIGLEIVATGDYSGPNGARTVLRDRRVGVAVLETARGGLLRRGLAIPRATVALVTNVAADHMGEFGVSDLAGLADAKLVVAKAIDAKGRVVLNADDPLLLERGMRLAAPVTWFTLDPSHPQVLAHLAAGGEACVLDRDSLVLALGSERRDIARVAEVPVTFGGAARHNVANALAAIGVGLALGLEDAALREGLLRFENTPAENPGRANRWRIGGVEVLVDYAHNPHGLAAIAGLVAAIPAKRRAVVVGQAGDRDDAAIRALARGAWAMQPDRVFVKEMEPYLRGRESGVVPALILEELVAAGARPEQISRSASEMEAVGAALAWAKPGDLLFLAIHVDRAAVIARLDALAARGWRAGEPL
jgi:cyanophycin synthetase